MYPDCVFVCRMDALCPRVRMDRGLFMVCSVPCLAPGMYGCVSLCFCVNVRAAACRSLHVVCGLGLMPFVGCGSFPCTHYWQDVSRYLHLTYLIMVCGGGGAFRAHVARVLRGPLVVPMSLLIFARCCSLFVYEFGICCGLGWESQTWRGVDHVGVCRGVGLHGAACCEAVLQRLAWRCPR